MSPTYKNVTHLKQAVNGKVVDPGQMLYSTVYFDENEIKLLKVDDAPYYNPIIYSDVVTEPGTIKIPEKDSLGLRVTKYAIHFYLEKGTIDILYNSGNNKPALRLYPTAKWNLRCFERHIDKIIVESAESFVLNVIIEKV